MSRKKTLKKLLDFKSLVITKNVDGNDVCI